MKTRIIFWSTVFLLSTFTGSVYGGFEGDLNTFYGTGAGNSTADDNDFATFIGFQAGFANTTGNSNSFLGYRAGFANTTGSGNSFLGSRAGFANTTGDSNSFLGLLAGYSNTTGNSNSFLGDLAGYSNTTGDSNSFLGDRAGYSNTTGYNNSFLGDRAGYSNTTGIGNTFLGREVGYSNTTGSGNVFLGYRTGYNEAGSNKLYIDNSNTSSPLIYGEFDTNKLTINGNLEVIGPDNGLVRLSNVITNNTTKVARMVARHYNNAEEPLYLFGAASTAAANFVAFGGGSPVGNAATQLDLFTAPNTTTPTGTSRLTIIGNGYVGIGTQGPTQPLQMASGAHVTVGGVWTNASSREYKDNINNLKTEDALETLRGLNPVTFNYKASPGEDHVGFIAEEVPDLVATKDRKGLSPMDIVAVLTKVVQEQQKVVKELKAENEGLKAKNESLESRLLMIEGKIPISK